MRLGIDISTYLEELEHGASYHDGASRVEPLSLFRANGVDIMRIRVWVDPKSECGEPYLAGNCDLDNFLRLAKLGTDKGFRIMLDLHYSDFWADPGKQMIPKSWKGLDFDGLKKRVYEYTRDVLKEVEKSGIAVEFIQVGNEITNGMLWPFGYLQEQPGGCRTNYDSLTALLKSGIKACREYAPQAAVILHLEKSYDQQIYGEYFEQMAAANVDFDIIGYSYYPYWHGTFEQFFANIEFCKKFGKRQMVVELGYAFTVEDYIKSEHGGAQLVVSNDSGFVKEYPLTPQGQALFTREFLREAEAHGIEAVLWWEPLWIPGEGICWTSDAGKRYIDSDKQSNRNEWANQCLFDYSGRKLPAFDAFKRTDIYKKNIK